VAAMIDNRMRDLVVETEKKLQAVVTSSYDACGRRSPLS
jgi:hypothetical protein